MVGKVSKINLEDKEVILENDEALKYTHLVMAVGSTGPYPGRAKAKRKGLMEDDYRNLSSQVNVHIL